MLLSTDQKLIHAILQGGIKSYYKARSEGVRAEILFDEAPSIWTLIEDMAAKGRLPSIPEIHTVTGHYIEEICPEPIDAELIAKSVVKRGLSAQLNEKFGELTSKDLINQDPFKVRDEMSQIITDVAWSYGEPYSINSRAGLEQLMEAYERAEGRGSKLLGLSSPWPTMDQASLGLQPGELTVVFAKRKIGKSWCVIVWGVHIWKNDLKPGEKILFVTMEMTPLQVLRRMACVDLRLSWGDFRGGKLTTQEKKKLEDWVEKRMEADQDDPDIVIVGSNQVRTVKDLSAVVGEHKPKCVIVDSFYILGRASGRSLHERVLTNVQELKLDIALQHEVPVLCSTQLKGTTSKDVLEASSDDAMGAKAIGDYADVTRGLFADKEYMAANQRLWRGMEAREFLGKDLKINFNLNTMDFSEIEEVVEGQAASTAAADADTTEDVSTTVLPGKPRPTAPSDEDDDYDRLVV